MDETIVVGYLNTIKNNSEKLLSINQEEANPYGDGRKHIIVSDVAAKVGGLKRLSRTPHWFLENYVEEIYIRG